ncbi:hypothetical protein C0583_06955 [Candidatus Parcubacteria bacterium]|nr:MAG: hypothetical protein C0583_06955 [Candidatus Parcubacteria bacterium]
MSDWVGKWNYKPKFIGDFDQDTMERFKVAQMQELFNVRTIQRTAFLNDILDKVIYFANEVLDDLLFPRIDISKEQFCLLTKKEFDEKVAMRDSDAGKCHTGFVYVMVNKDIVRFIHDLTHEISHLVSFYCLIIKKLSPCKQSVSNQQGYTINCRNGRHYFGGLDEATTELFARRIRKKIVDQTDLLSFEEWNKLCSFFVYIRNVSLLITLLTTYIESDISDKLLFKSYIDGSSDFLKAVERVLPGANKHLMTLEGDTMDVGVIAYRMGGKRLESAFKKELSYFFP